jgi:hypothetical protein
MLQSLLPQHIAAALAVITQSYQSRAIDQHLTVCILDQSTPERSTLPHACAESVDIAKMLCTQPIAGKFGGIAHGNSSHHPNLITTTYRLLQHAALSVLLCFPNWSHVPPLHRVWSGCCATGRFGEKALSVLLRQCLHGAMADTQGTRMEIPSRRTLMDTHNGQQLRHFRLR